MLRTILTLSALFLFLPAVFLSSDRTQPYEKFDLTPEAVNDPVFIEPLGADSAGPEVLRVQILLDRAHFSPGEIDARYGRNTISAVAAFQEARGLRPTGIVDQPTWDALNQDRRPAIVRYRLAESDVVAEGQRIPKDMMEKARLDRLEYESALEALGERFHASPRLLQAINPGADFKTPGEEIFAPDVGPLAAGLTAYVEVKPRSVTALDEFGQVLAHYPATSGSQHDPLPAGKWKINGVFFYPHFQYNPDLFWDADPAHSKATIAPGPNSPVGVVWIALSKKHYGIHGTPEPSKIGYTQSHGCIRLTNWDAAELAAMITPGTPAILQTE